MSGDVAAPLLLARSGRHGNLRREAGVARCAGGDPRSCWQGHGRRVPFVTAHLANWGTSIGGSPGMDDGARIGLPHDPESGTVFAASRRRAGPSSQLRETGPVTAPDPEPGAQPSSRPRVADAAGPSEKPSGARRVLHILGAALVVVVLPVGLMEALAGRLGAAAMIVGLLLGVLGSKIGGTRRMLYLAPAVAVSAGLGAITAYAGRGWRCLRLSASSLAAGSGSGGWRRC